MSKLLLIGPCLNQKNPSHAGGIIVLFENLLQELTKKQIDYTVIDTNKSNYRNLLFAMILIYFKIFFFSLRTHHISLHGTAKDYIFIAPFTVLLSKILGKSCSLRKFAGNFNSLYESSSIFKKKLIEFALKNSHYNFFETQYLVHYFKSFNDQTYWFPNVRERQTTISQHEFRKKFVFISQLYKTKGIDEILEASNLLPDDYTIDLYGPLRDTYTTDSFNHYKASYRGSLQPNDVLKVLQEYDVLLLPTYYPGEGYPGIIIEALSIGKPVIVTPLESIKEMVDESCAVFVQAKNPQELRNAILTLDEKNYPIYSANALKYFESFDSDIQTEKFLNLILKEA